MITNPYNSDFENYCIAKGIDLDTVSLYYLLEELKVYNKFLEGKI